jgi:hypothetical protein
VTPDRCLQSITARPEPNLLATGEPSIDVEGRFADPVFAADVGHSGAAALPARSALPYIPSSPPACPPRARPQDHACRAKLNLSLAGFSGFGARFSGNEQEVQISLPKGFIWQVANAVKTAVMKITTPNLNFDHSGRNAFWTRIELVLPAAHRSMSAMLSALAGSARPVTAAK